MFTILIKIIPDGPDGYKLDISTTLPEESLVKKVLEETLESWDDRTSESFEESNSTVPDGYNDYY